MSCQAVKIQSAALVLLLSVLAGCARPKTPFSLDEWTGRTLDGAEVRFSEVSEPALILNFYSPTCQPCIEELPALEILYKKA